MMNHKGLLIIVSGPSGAGKGTICKELIQRDDSIVVSVSATTRAPRNAEVDGKSYHFITKQMFESMIENGGFLEYAEVYDNYYGTPKDFVIEKITNGENVLLEIDIQGALQVKQKYPEGIFVFVLPPSMETLKNRIVGRGSETPESLEKRMSSAYQEIEQIKNYDYFIVNDTVEHSTDVLQAIITAEKCRVNADIKDIVVKFKEEKENA
jgi:guanylate kinase